MVALKAAIQKEMYEALEETIEDSYQDLKNNVNHFYDSPEGRYKRTGQLRDSPQLDGINYSGDSAQGQISINTGTQYSPSGRDTATIYGYAEAGGLLGMVVSGKEQKSKFKIILMSHLESDLNEK